MRLREIISETKQRLDAKKKAGKKPKQMNEYIVRSGDDISSVLSLNLFKDLLGDANLSDYDEEFANSPEWQAVVANWAPKAEHIQKDIYKFQNIGRKLRDAEADAIDATMYDGSDAYEDAETAASYLPKVYARQAAAIVRLLKDGYANPPEGMHEARAASASTRAGLAKMAKLNAMSPEQRKAYDKKRAEQVRKRDDARTEKERAEHAKKMALKKQSGIAEDDGRVVSQNPTPVNTTHDYARSWKRKILQSYATLGRMRTEAIWALEENVYMNKDQILDYIDHKAQDPSLTALEYMHDLGHDVDGLFKNVTRFLTGAGISPAKIQSIQNKINKQMGEISERRMSEEAQAKTEGVAPVVGDEVMWRPKNAKMVPTPVTVLAITSDKIKIKLQSPGLIQRAGKDTIVVSIANSDISSRQGITENEDTTGVIAGVLKELIIIYQGAALGEDMTDNIADELGDYYDAVANSNNAVLQKVYSYVREWLPDTDSDVQATGTLKAIRQLTGDRSFTPPPRPPTSPEAEKWANDFADKFAAALASRGIKAHPDWNKPDDQGVAEDFNVDDIGAAECPRCHRNDLTWNDDAQHVECRGCGAEYTEQGKEIKQGVAEGSGGNWYIRVNGKILNDTKFKPVIFSSEDEARSHAMKLADKKHIPLSQIKLTKSWMDAPEQGVAEEWSKKYKSSINCSNPKGFSQKAHCAGKKKKNEGLTHDEAFDYIEEMVESLALAHGVDVEQIWEDLESVDDFELLEESAAWHRKAGKSKTGGLNDKGIASYRREHPGSKLQKAVTTKPSKLKKGSKAAKRRKSFCARMSGNKGPMKKPNGKPTRKALALRKWNC